MILTSFVALGIVYLLHKCYHSFHLIHSKQLKPYRFQPIRPFSLLSESLPTWVSWSIVTCWIQHFQLFESLNSSVIYFHSLSTPQILVADAEAASVVFKTSRIFVKPIQDYSILSFFGTNVVVTEGDEWRRHRKLTAPSFSEKNNLLVWNETIRVVDEWTDVQSDDEEVDTVSMTLRMALMIISAAAFGQRSPWPTNNSIDQPPPGRKLGFISALKGTLDGTIAKLMLPNWVYKLPLEYPRHIALCFSELEGQLRDMIVQRRLDESSGSDHNDLFSALLSGVNDSDEKDPVLTTEELLGNMYIFLLAGHETTAHTLAFVFTLLALYPEHQDILYAEAEAAFGGGSSTYEDYGKLPYALATFQEGLRLFPPVVLIPKLATQDTYLPAHTTPSDGSEPEKTQIFVSAGSRVSILVSSLHFNPMYWPDPFKFEPSRFIDTEEKKWNRDAWAPFSGGPRACLGIKFALAESIAIIANITHRFKIEIPPSLIESYKAKDGESERDRRERIFKCKNAITLTPGGTLPLLFKKRNRD